MESIDQGLAQAEALKSFLELRTFRGNEIVSATRGLALMNLFRHNIGDFEGGLGETMRRKMLKTTSLHMILRYEDLEAGIESFREICEALR